MNRQQVCDELRSALAGCEPSVVAAWLFGSVARGTDRPASDVDVAILRTTDLPPARLADLPLDLEDRLARRLSRTVQVVDAGRAPADLVHRILRDGVLLLDRDRSRRIAFEVAARNRYFDMAPVWSMIRARSVES